MQLKFYQVCDSVINSLQMAVEDLGGGLRVGPISDDDYRVLSSGYSELDWCWGFDNIGHSDEKFELCIKIQQNNTPDGAMLGSYNLETKAFEIHLIESFVRQNSSHPLYGRMFKISLIASYLLISAVNGDKVHIIEPTNQGLIEFYKTHGFSMLSDESSTILSIDKDSLTDVVQSFF